MKPILLTVILGLLGTTGFFWHSLRDVSESFTSYAVDTEYSRIMQAQKIETMLREGQVGGALAQLQSHRDLAIVRLGQMKPHIDTTTWRMSRSQYAIDKLDTAIEKEVEYRRVNGETSSKLAEQARSVLETYEE